MGAVVEALAQERVFHNHGAVHYDRLKEEVYRVIKDHLLIERLLFSIT